VSETIFALATAPGRSGVAVLRLSGEVAFTAATAIAGTLPPTRQVGLRTLRDPASGNVIDEALVVSFRSPASFTGEDVVEFQVHGGTAVVEMLSAALGRQQGLRQARPGEFTRRALANGRLDLVQVEALADLVDAETAAQQRQAMDGLRGRLGELAGRWRAAILEALALVEASIDFADEELPAGLAHQAAAGLDGILAEMRHELRGAKVAERLRAGFEVAIVGPPNVGKSTLLNAIAGREAAITSEIPGTTRDVIEVRLDLEGLPVTLLDTAGIRAADEAVEGLGIARGRERAEEADLRVFLVETPMQIRLLGLEQVPGDIVATAKGDLRPGADAVSGLTGAGIEGLLARLTGGLRERMAGLGGLGHARQREAVVRSVAAVEAARVELCGAQRLELVAEELRSALRALDFLMGRVDVEAVLDTIFARFCLGK
jgi:tRNA modification GTPase